MKQCPAALRCVGSFFFVRPLRPSSPSPGGLASLCRGRDRLRSLRCGACVHFPPAESGQKGRRGAITPKAKRPPEPPVRSLRGCFLLHPSPASAAGLRFPLLIAGVSAETPLRHRTAGRARSAQRRESGAMLQGAALCGDRSGLIKRGPRRSLRRGKEPCSSRKPSSFWTGDEGRRDGQPPTTSCLPLTREVASPKGLTEGEIGRAYGEAGCTEGAGCEFSPSVACGDSSLVRGSQGGLGYACGQAPQREPSPARDDGSPSEGAKGLGCACGQAPLPSFFVSCETSLAIRKKCGYNRA